LVVKDWDRQEARKAADEGLNNAKRLPMGEGETGSKGIRRKRKYEKGTDLFYTLRLS